MVNRKGNSAPTLVQSKLSFKPISAEERKLKEVIQESLKRRRSLSTDNVRGVHTNNDNKRKRSLLQPLKRSKPDKREDDKKESKSTVLSSSSTKQRGQKELKMDKNGVVKITRKLDYLLGIPPDATGLTVAGISLSTVDSRILVLQNLKRLDLSGNRLTNVNVFRQMGPTLQSVNLSNNNISSLDGRLRFPWLNVKCLDLSKNKVSKANNQLTKRQIFIPDSFVHMFLLNHLNVSDNQLRCVPFNIATMNSLRTLLIQRNCLKFLPGSLVHNYQLNIINISDNTPLLHQIGRLEENQFLLPGFGTPRGDIPTLLEISAKAVLNRQYNKPGHHLPRRFFPDLNESALPSTLVEYLHRSQKCNICRLHTPRYMFYFDTAPCHSLATQVTTDKGIVRVISAICPEHAFESRLTGRLAVRR